MHKEMGRVVYLIREYTTQTLLCSPIAAITAMHTGQYWSLLKEDAMNLV